MAQTWRDEEEKRLPEASLWESCQDYQYKMEPVFVSGSTIWAAVEERKSVSEVELPFVEASLV